MKFKTPSRAATTLTLGMALLVATTFFAQQLSAQKSPGETTAKRVCEMIKRFHISQEGIDDEIAVKLFDKFVKDLDPQKLYFTQADIDELAKQKTQLDNLIKAGNIDFAYTTYDLYLKRLDQRMAMAEKFIDVDHDFTLDESIPTSGKDLSWAKTNKEISERWRKRIKFDLLTLRLDKTELVESKKRLHKRYHNIKNVLHQTEDFEKLETYLTALAMSFDPHSTYMSPESLEDFRIQMALQLDGIGAALRSEDGTTTVAQIVPGGAADANGKLKVGDKIIGVGQGADGKDFVDVVEMKLSKVVRFIRGKRGTVVRLQVKTGDAGDVKVYTLTRQKIELKSSAVKGEIIDLKKRLPGSRGKVGVINIPSFYRDFQGAQRGVENFKSTARDVRTVLKQFDDAGGVDVVVIDLRFNGGGALTESIEVSGLFIDEGPVVQVKDSVNRSRSHDDEDQGVAYDGPLVVVCNRLSASASEIFAGVIKDYRRGIIIGDETTHGKGTVQNVMPVSTQLFRLLNPNPGKTGALKLTISQFYRVNGHSTQNRGVPSDVVLPSLFDHMDLGEAFLDNALKFDQIAPAKFTPTGDVSDQVVKSLQQASGKRVKEDPKFKEDLQEIAKYLKRKNRKTISLNEEVLREERNKSKKKDDKKDPDKKPDENPPVLPEGHYNNEILRIASDYAGALAGTKTAEKAK
jgi:carboxyl-terminal processing protease